MSPRFHAFIVTRVCFVLMMLPTATALAIDFNNDGLSNCQDIDLLSTAIDTGSDDPTFDLDLDGFVDFDDLDYALDELGSILGDANLDGRVDRLDANVFGMNWQQETKNGYCQADFTRDGRVDANDRGILGIQWQVGVNDGDIHPATVVAASLPHSLDIWRDGGHVFAEMGPLELLAIPQRAPAGLLATKIAIRTKDPSKRLVSFDYLAITGDLHQVFTGPVPFTRPTPNGLADSFIQASTESLGIWNAADSQLLITPDMIGGGAGGSYAGISEENDFSDPVQTSGTLPELVINEFAFDPPAGVGNLEMTAPTDIFMLDTEEQSNYIELAYIVTVAKRSIDDEVGQVFLRVGIQGGDDANNPLPFDGIIGLDEPLTIPFFAQPCDFNADATCDQTDLDLLLGVVGSENADFNLDGSDPPLITQSDVAQWSNFANPIPGDTDYDGDVDAADLNSLARHWLINNSNLRKSPRLIGWDDGDFDANMNVDAGDLNFLAMNWLHGVDPPAAMAVPEPTVSILLIWIGLVYLTCHRRIGRCAFQQAAFCQ